MKKFLISFIIGLVLISAGSAMLVFEWKDYEFVDASDKYLDKFNDDEFEFDIKENGLLIEMNDDLKSFPIQYEYDDKMKGKVRIEFPNNMKYKLRSNTLIFKDLHYDNFDLKRFNEMKGVFDVFVDGLKEKKIYVMNDYNKYGIKVTCSKEEKEKITIIYD